MPQDSHETHLSMDHSDLKGYLASVRRRARGLWPHIFDDLAPELREAMAEVGYHVPCPVHGGVDGFRLFPDFQDTGGGFCNTCKGKGDGIRMLAWLRGINLEQAAQKIEEYLGQCDGKPRKKLELPKPKHREVDFESNLRYIKQLSAEAIPIKGTPVETYLIKRGIYPENISRQLRAHPRLNYVFRDGSKTQTWGMLATLRDPAGRVVAMHRTYITEDGDKASFVCPVRGRKLSAKKLTGIAGPLEGAAIRLFEADSSPVLGFAEGIETAHAAYAISRVPCWATYSAQLMEQVVIPDHVRHVVIWQDKDVSGRGAEAASALMRRLTKLKRTWEVCIPPGDIPSGEKGIDWLDVLVTKGIEGFPLRWRNWTPTATPSIATA